MMKKSLAYLAALSLTTACGGGDDAGQTQADSAATSAAPAAAPAAPAVTDPQIAAIVVAANEADIKWARLALEKTQNAQVRGFAEAMVNDHGGVNQQAVELVTRLGVAPEPNPTSQQL
jgi:putative membrane protein